MATTRAVTGDLDAHTPCKYPASPVPIPGVHIEVVYGTRGCPGVMDTCDYRSELIYGSTTGMYGIIERHEVNLRRVGRGVPRVRELGCPPILALIIV